MFLMQTRLKLLPGQRGTKKLTQKYGDQLVCVRYRYDTERNRRYKTVELIVDEIPWIANSGTKYKGPARSDKVVFVRVGYGERGIRNRVKEAGGKWNSAEKVWSLPYRKAVEFGLEKRIVQ
jgi:argonaute-like protein implicated in RNA metabolism and viral defense